MKLLRSDLLPNVGGQLERMNVRGRCNEQVQPADLESGRGFDEGWSGIA
jgi:hypothetical protein